MTTFLITFCVISLTFAALALGVLLGREPIKGSCGGLNNCQCARSCARRQRTLQARRGGASEI